MNPKIRHFVRSLVPRSLLCGARAGWIFVRLRGQVQTDSNGLITDAAGNHQPWLTYPAIDFLNTFDLTGLDIYEFGGGSSTLYWLEKGARVSSVDHDPNWQKRVQEILGERATIQYRPQDATYARTIRETGRTFDVVVVDGAVRYNCAAEGAQVLKPGGIIVLDNSEWYPGACKMLRDQGFTQLDFEGFTPFTSFPSVTSVFFRDRIGLKYKPKPAKWVPIGANPFPHVDDDRMV